MHGLGKPLHTWELQYNLWAISMTGTNEERFAFMAIATFGLFIHVSSPDPDLRRKDVHGYLYDDGLLLPTPGH